MENSCDKEYVLMVDIIGGHEEFKCIDEMMHATDVLEKGKRLAIVNVMKVTLSSLDTVDLLCDNITKAYKDTGGYVLFAGINAINGERPPKRKNYLEQGIHTLSMPHDEKKLAWSLFKDVLEYMGYSAETDERMHVIAVK